MIQDDISVIVREQISRETFLKQKQASLYCKRLGINYNKLSDAEFRQLVHIFEKSKFFKSYAGQRKKCTCWRYLVENMA